MLGDWQEDGPELPLEFARQSADDRITLVIADGAQVSRSLWVRLDVRSPEDAIAALARREGTSKTNIGRWPNSGSPENPLIDLISEWAQARRLDTVVWTALPPGMKSQRGVIPDLADLVSHLCALEHDVRDKAAEYVFKAPPQIATRYRERLQKVLTGS